MTRHGKNSTAGSVYTYHEKKRDTKTSGYGSLRVRLGKDSVKEFDCCSLTLQPCRHPVVTPDGHVFDKQTILEYIIHKKRDIAKKLKEFAKQKSNLEVVERRETREKRSAQLERLKNSRMVGLSGTTSTDAASVSNMKTETAKELPSFWIPSLTPQAKSTLLKKPDERVKCPMTGKNLRMKDMVDVIFTEIKDGDTKKSLITKEARYVCAVTNDVLGNSVPCVVLKTSGNVVTVDCLERIIKKDMIDPTNSKPLKETDIIYLQRGASGFSAAGGDSLQATKAGPAMMS